MNYSALFKNFRRELSQNFQYKELDNPFKTFAFIATFPFWVAYVSLLIMKYVYLFIFNCIAASTEYLESWVKETKEGVHSWTEAVIYLVSMPFIFFTRVLLSGFSVTFYFLWFMMMCACYIASLGGIKWQPFISSAKFSENEVLESTTNPTAGNIIALMSFIFLCLYIFVYYIIGFGVGDFDAIRFGSVCGVIYFLFTIIAIPVTFKHQVVVVEDEKSVESQKVNSQDKNDFEEEFPEF